MIKSKKVCERFAVKPTAAETIGEDGGPTTAIRPQLEDRAWRGANGNAVVVSVLTLQEVFYHKVVKSVVATTEVLDMWHTCQNRELGSVEGCQSWIVQQTSGGYMEHVGSFFGVLSERALLERSGVSINFAGGTGAKLQKQMPDFDLALMEEEEQAEVLGQLVLSFVAQRLVRGLWLCSWPTRMCACLHSDEVAQQTIADFKADEEVYDFLASRESPSAAEAQLLKRHVMGLRSNKQLRQAFGELGYVLSPALQTVLEERSRLNIQTQIVEDMNGEMKNSSQLKACRRYRKPALCPGVCLSKNIACNRHAFTSLSMVSPVPVFDAKLPADAFRVDRSKASHDFDGLVSSSAATWWSPSATNLTIPCADVGMLRWAFEHNQFELLGKAWLGEVAHCSHRLLLGFPTGVGASKFEWFLALYAFPKSAMALWPVHLRKLSGTSWTIVTPRRDVRELVRRPS